MKIVFISCNDWVPWGGSEELWYKTAITLQSLGHDVHVSVKKWEPIPSHIAKAKTAGCTVFERGFKPQYDLVSRIKRMFIKESFNQEEQNHDYLNDLKPDFVIINQGSVFDGMHWAKTCKKLNIAYGVIVQLVNEYIFYGDAEVQKLQEIYMNAIKVYFVSLQNQTTFEKMIGMNITNAEVVRNPFREYHGAINYPDIKSGYHLASIASLNPLHKGHPLLFEVLSDPKWLNRDLHVNLFGKGIAENTYKQQLKYFGLKNVSLKGFESDLNKVWSNNHGLIICSRMEGQSLALIEAMYCSRMPIVTNVGGASEIIQDGVSGFIAKSPSIWHIDEALEMAWKQKENWEEIGKQSRMSVINNFPKDPVMDFAQKIASVNILSNSSKYL